ncbi:hypothetical protein BD309DRAFT_975011 [Dichomitus squalens]|nr:hypothetical protein BD309DRAFT_975011 [Dichomitus squalens]
MHRAEHVGTRHSALVHSRPYTLICRTNTVAPTPQKGSTRMQAARASKRSSCPHGQDRTQLRAIPPTSLPCSARQPPSFLDLHAHSHQTGRLRRKPIPFGEYMTSTEPYR